MKNSELPLYKPPRARDLSAFSASGMVPLGNCSTGNVPYTGCDAGTIPNLTPDCSPGFEVGVDPQCRPGSWASSTCHSGGAAG